MNSKKHIIYIYIYIHQLDKKPFTASSIIIEWLQRFDSDNLIQYSKTIRMILLH